MQLFVVCYKHLRTWDRREEIPSRIRRTHYIVISASPQLSLTTVDIREEVTENVV